MMTSQQSTSLIGGEGNSPNYARLIEVEYDNISYSFRLYSDAKKTTLNNFGIAYPKPQKKMLLQMNQGLYSQRN